MVDSIQQPEDNYRQTSLLDSTADMNNTNAADGDTQEHVDWRKRANLLDGKTWLKYSISIWSDIRKTQEEIDLDHPAIFPTALVSRLIEIFTNDSQRLVFDPFSGVGSTAIAARNMGKIGVGIELNPEYVAKAQQRINQGHMLTSGEAKIIQGNSLDILTYLEPESVDLIVTSPPYWDVLSQKRTADYKAIRDYGNEAADLGKITDYWEFLQQLKKIFALAYQVLKPGAFCCVVVMDLRKKDKFYPFHSDIATFMTDLGYIYDDLIIWDRRHEYNNMRPLGYPTVFRVNKAHEFIIICRRPAQNKPEHRA